MNAPGVRDLPIASASLTLRLLASDDASKLFEMSQEDGMRAWLPSQVYRDAAHAASVLAFLMAQYERPADPRIAPYVLGVELRGTGQLVGHVGFSPLHQEVEIGFAIETAHQCRGIATEAVRAACDWATEAFSLTTILGVTAASNLASQGVLQRAGFVRRSEQEMRFQGLVQPVIVFARSS